MKDELREFKKTLPSPWKVILSLMFFNVLFFYIPHIPFILQWLADSLFSASFAYAFFYWLLPSPPKEFHQYVQSPEELREWDEHYRIELLNTILNKGRTK